MNWSFTIAIGIYVNKDGIYMMTFAYRHFKDIHIKAIDEVWYRRAVEQNYDDPIRFIYTVPFNSGKWFGLYSLCFYLKFRPTS